MNSTLFESIKQNNINTAGFFSPFSFSRPGNTKKTVRFLKEVCKQFNINIVHALFATPNAMWAYYSGLPYIITTRGSDILHVIPQLKNPPLSLFYTRLLYNTYRRAFQNASYITSTSVEQKRKIETLFGIHNVELVRTGIDTEIISALNDKTLLPETLRGKKYIISPRWINPLYNTLTQAEAIAMLDRKILEEYIFVFFRNYSTSMEYQAQLEKTLKNSAGIQYLILDSLPQKEMLTCTRFASLSIMIPDRDGTPNAALEAMAARCPLILGNFNYDSDLFTNNCVRLKENTAGALAAAISKALTSYPDVFIENALKIVQQSGNRTREMEKIFTLYNNLR
jgi:glycosyltransferase involved in cell wall biosynthesis